VTIHTNIDPHDEIVWGPSGGRASDAPVTDKGAAPNPLGDDPSGAETPPLAPNKSDIETFLRDYVGTIIHVVSIKPDAAENDPDKIHGRYFGDAVGDAATWLTAKNASGRNCYWTVNVTAADLNRKPAKKDIVAARFSHADIDPPKGSAGMDKDAALADLLKLDLVPSFVVDSGNGLQPLWRKAYAPKEWTLIENTNRAIAKKLGADNCHNIDRLLRVPGTINWPDATKRARGRVPVLTRLAHDGGRDAIYTPDQLARVFPPIAVAEKESKTSSGEDIGEIELLTPDDLGLSALSPLRSVIEHPAGLDRSKDGIRAAGDLLRAGFTKLQVLGILLNPKNKVSAHYVEQADPRRAALRVIQWLEEHKSDEAKGQDNDSGNAGAQKDNDKGANDSGFGSGAAALVATPWKWVNPEDVSPREFLYGTHYIRQFLSVGFGAPGGGKSTKRMVEAIACASEKPLLGVKPVKKLKVWYWNGEDPQAETDRRFAAICKLGQAGGDRGLPVHEQRARYADRPCRAGQDRHPDRHADGGAAQGRDHCGWNRHLDYRSLCQLPSRYRERQQRHRCGCQAVLSDCRCNRLRHRRGTSYPKNQRQRGHRGRWARCQLVGWRGQGHRSLE
jgi:hypothetical protein